MGHSASDNPILKQKSAKKYSTEKTVLSSFKLVNSKLISSVHIKEPEVSKGTPLILEPARVSQVYQVPTNHERSGEDAFLDPFLESPLDADETRGTLCNKAVNRNNTFMIANRVR
mmetsp:Transcript_6067/g.13354  ORF Transcript_6067/g.13354 Transcript_6067/m.13354 type:complete len:115 (+) Transcript_6067:391-735(+)